ncbi:hypothetical protein GGQ73_000629 [Rhizobium skierniewicense]|uniref:Uncharacterized protein n=1 Tax=Rhizobium skierniewicense TaxID=984260 RepID=A0A7W6G0S6_9HYPH|nr:hypothetical protein [Rhizobium skierniewicense]MBB3944704.1 hypothetical protein [Rhizobium skierniewicense]
MIGFTPQQVNEMSVWQFMAMVDGYVEANSPDDGSLTAKEVDELWDFVQA